MWTVTHMLLAVSQCIVLSSARHDAESCTGLLVRESTTVHSEAQLLT